MGIFDILKALNNLNPFTSVTSNKGVYSIGPNNLEELLKQFSQPKKEKTNDDIIRDYMVQETMAALEVDMLKMDPPFIFRGFQRWKDNEGNTFFDWVPCVVRPEVIYCSNGKS